MMDDSTLAERAGQLSAEAQHLYGVTTRRKETLRTAAEHALAATGTAESHDGAVRAIVDAGGMLTGLVLDKDALRISPEELARLVITVTQEAAAHARAAVRAVYEPLRGEGIVRGVPVLLPGPAPESEPRTRPRRTEIEEEASFEERSITRRRGRR